MHKVDFTVLIPVFNTKAAALIEAVYSVSRHNQTIDQDYDILLVDDGSTNPETGDAMEFLKRALGVKVAHLPTNGGTSAALNYGHSIVQTPYVALSGSSDISFKDRFKLQVEHLQQHPEVDVLGTNLFWFNHDDPFRISKGSTNHKYTRTLKDSDYGWLTNHGTTFYKVESVNEVGGYDLGYRRGQDTNLWKRMFLANKKIHTLASIQYGWRRNE